MLRQSKESSLVECGRTLAVRVSGPGRRTSPRAPRPAFEEDRIGKECREKSKLQVIIQHLLDSVMESAAMASDFEAGAELGRSEDVNA